MMKIKLDDPKYVTTHKIPSIIKKSNQNIIRHAKAGI